MGGGKSYRGLPVPNPTAAYWQVPPSDISGHRTTTVLPATADYVIVGSGITGAGVALRLLEHLSANTQASSATSGSHASVLMLEARTTCSGATGRNGGHCRAGWWGRFANLHEKYGAEEAVKFERFEDSTVAAVAAFVHDNGIECDFKDVEATDVLVNEEEWRVLMESWKLRQAYEKDSGLGPRKVLEGREAVEHCKIPAATGAVVFEGHTAHPYKLVTSILKMCLGKGLNLQTSTPVLSLERSGQASDNENQATEDTSPESFHWIVKTERGTIHAKNVILATNAYTNALYPELASSQFLIPTRAQAMAIRPGSGMAGDPVLSRSVGIDGGLVEDYLITRTSDSSAGEQDIIYGGGRHMSSTDEFNTLDDATLHPDVQRYLRSAPATHFGQSNWGVEGGEVLMEWTGIMGFTKDGYPLVGEAPGRKGLWVAAGFNGHGMALSFRCSEALVGMMLGLDGGRWPQWMPKAFRVDRAWEESEHAGIVDYGRPVAKEHK